jgi:hypothetical protein
MLAQLYEYASVLLQHLQRPLGASFMAMAQYVFLLLLVVRLLASVQGCSVALPRVRQSWLRTLRAGTAGGDSLVDAYAQCHGDPPCTLRCLVSVLDVVGEGQRTRASSRGGAGEEGDARPRRMRYTSRILGRTIGVLPAERALRRPDPSRLAATTRAGPSAGARGRKATQGVEERGFHGDVMDALET